MPSLNDSAARRARVKLQLRDKKGRWIEMGGLVRWFKNGEESAGTVLNTTADGNAQIKVTSKVGKGTTVTIAANKLETVTRKAVLQDPNNEPKIEEPKLREGEEFKPVISKVIVNKNNTPIKPGDEVKWQDYTGVRHTGKIEYAMPDGKLSIEYTDEQTGKSTIQPPEYLLRADESYSEQDEKEKQPESDVSQLGKKPWEKMSPQERAEVNKKDKANAEKYGIPFTPRKVENVLKEDEISPEEAEYRRKNKFSWSEYSETASNLALGTIITNSSSTHFTKVDENTWEYDGASGRISFNDNSIDSLKKLDSTFFNVELSEY